MTFQTIREAAQAKIESSSKKQELKLLRGVVSLMNALEEKAVDPADVSEELSILQQELSGETKFSRVRSCHGSILKRVKNKYGYTTPGYYQTQWMAIGIGAFGLPLGLAFALAINNFAYMSIGLPIGMPIGMATGAAKDKKAKDEGKMLTL